MRQCVRNHDTITWYDDTVPCPLCEALQEIERLKAELHKATRAPGEIKSGEVDPLENLKDI